MSFKMKPKLNEGYCAGNNIIKYSELFESNHLWKLMCLFQNQRVSF